MPIRIEIAPDGPLTGIDTVVQISNSDGEDVTGVLSLSVGTTQADAEVREFGRHEHGAKSAEHSIYIEAGRSEVVSVYGWNDTGDQNKTLFATFVYRDEKANHSKFIS